jgi:hypothetical protein
VLRRRVRTRFIVCERRRSRRVHRAIRAGDVRAADLEEEPTKPVEDRADLRHSGFVGCDEDGGSQANIAKRQSERSE